MNTVRGWPPVDLLDLNMDIEFMSAESRQQLMVPLSVSNEGVPRQELHFNDVAMKVTGANGVNVSRKQPYNANLIQQARIGRDFQSFDVAPAPRPIRAHRRRRSRHRLHNHPYRHSDYYTPDYVNYFDRDACRPQRGHYSPSRRRHDSTEALKHRPETIFVAAMADLDVKEERDYDRRGTDSYRGGGNKRRRDGRLVTTFSRFQQLTRHR